MSKWPVLMTPGCVSYPSESDRGPKIMLLVKTRMSGTASIKSYQQLTLMSWSFWDTLIFGLVRQLSPASLGPTFWSSEAQQLSFKAMRQPFMIIITIHSTKFYSARKTLMKKREEEKRKRLELSRRRENLINYYKTTWIQLICELAFIGKFCICYNMFWRPWILFCSLTPLFCAHLDATYRNHVAGVSSIAWLHQQSSIIVTLVGVLYLN